MNIKTLQVRDNLTNDLLYATGLSDDDYDDVQFYLPLKYHSVDDNLNVLLANDTSTDTKMFCVLNTQARYLVGDYTHFNVKIVDIDIN